MKQKIIFLMLLLLIPFVYAGCPGSQFAKIGVYYTITPWYDCFGVSIRPGCEPDSPQELTIGNSCTDDIVYNSSSGPKVIVAANFTNRAGKAYYDSVPQEVGAEWTREVYFANDPKNRSIIKAKNYPKGDYNLLIRKKMIYCKDIKGYTGSDYSKCWNEEVPEETLWAVEVPKPSLWDRITSWFRKRFVKSDGMETSP